MTDSEKPLPPPVFLDGEEWTVDALATHLGCRLRYTSQHLELGFDDATLHILIQRHPDTTDPANFCLFVRDPA